MALFGKRSNSDTPPAPIEPKPETVDTKEAEALPELDFLKEPPAKPAEPVSSAPSVPEGDAVIRKQPQYSQLILETEKPPVITVCRYGSNYVATDHVRNLQAVERTEYEALESLIKQYKK